MPPEVKCKSCGAENRAGAAFCGECGHRLASACPQCGAELRGGARFCDSCGAAVAAPARSETENPASYTPQHLRHKILQTRSALEGERRNVTVLFCDVAGYTGMSGTMDEEAVYARMQGFLARMLGAVHHHEGTVNQFLGDGVMAIFGAPVAHEDSARRAVEAALDMQQALVADGVRCRVGVNTGPVVIGKIGDNLRMDYTAVGDTTNLASRLQSLAELGSVYISESTYRQVRDYIECEEVGPLTVKGKPEPVPAYRAIRSRSAKSRFEAAAERGLTPLVGREHELTLLHGYLDRARRGQGQVVFLSGDAGLGKSRLLLEFRRSVEEAEIPWREGHCSSYGRKVPYLPIIGILQSVFGIEEGEADSEIIAKVDRSLSDRDQEDSIAPYLKFLLSVDPGDPTLATMAPELRRAGILNALRGLILARGRLGPAVLVVEDLHWIDEQSEEAITALVDAIGSVPVLMLLTYRPGYVSALGDRGHFNRISLAGLTAADTGRMSAAMLGGGDLPPAVADLVATKSDGNPLYVEEVTRSLVEAGKLRVSEGSYELVGSAAELKIPDTVQEIILARIDRLEERPRRALQLASVIGREFTVNLLDRISDLAVKVDALLGELKNLELIYEAAYFPELSYMFKHALTHDVAYASLLVERRRALHRLVAAAMEELYADRLASYFELLAHHYAEGEVWDKALEYAVKAGDKAQAAYANAQAIEFYRLAMEVAPRLEGAGNALASQAAMSTAMVSLTLLDIPGAVSATLQLADFARRSGDDDTVRLADAYRGFFLMLGHRFEESEPVLSTTAAEAERAGDDKAEGVATLGLYAQFLVTNRHPEARAISAHVDRFLAKASDPIAFGFGAYLVGLEKTWMGDYDDAIAAVAEWRGEVARLNLLLGTPMASNVWAAGLAYAARGDYNRAIADLNWTISTCEQIGEIWARARALNSIGWIYGDLQDHARAMHYNRQGLDVARVIGDKEIIANPLLNLADSHLAQESYDECQACLEEAFEIVDSPPAHDWMKWRYSQHAYHTRGQLRLAQGDAAAALADADRCLALAEESGSRKNIVKGRRLRAQAMRALGREVEAAIDLDTALSLAIAVGNPPQLWRTLAAAGRPDDALKVIEDVAAGLDDSELRDALLGSAEASQLRSG